MGNRRAWAIELAQVLLCGRLAPTDLAKAGFSLAASGRTIFLPRPPFLGANHCIANRSGQTGAWSVR
jgi:hypothetical protein